MFWTSEQSYTEGLDSFSPREKVLVLLPFLAPNYSSSAKDPLWSHGKWGILTMRLYSLTGEEPHRYITSTSWKHGERLKLFLWWAWFRKEISSGRWCHVPPFPPPRLWWSSHTGPESRCCFAAKVVCICVPPPAQPYKFHRSPFWNGALA